MPTEHDSPRPEPGTYLLWMRVPEPVTLVVGALGPVRLPAGDYGYVGSALGPGGVAGRVARHLRRERRNHWHVDYLSGAFPVDEVWFVQSPVRLEHRWAARLATLGGAIPVPRFGASDCRCAAHLLHFAQRPDLVSWNVDIDRKTRSGDEQSSRYCP